VSIQWSGLGPELLVRLDRDAAAPLRVQLETELRDAIRSGRLAADERLPSSRELARELGISRGLVQECYSQLLAEGYLLARTGSGTRVATLAGSGATRPGGPVASPAPAAASRAAEREPPIAFRPGRPDLTSFPRKDWAWAVKEAAQNSGPGDFGYGDGRGNVRLREVLAAYLRRVRGMVADPEQIIVCTGFAQGLNLVLRALKASGVDRIALEDPGTEQGEVPNKWGMEAVPIPVDDHGVVAEGLAATGARAVLLTPAHQSPTGVVLAPERRHQLVQWATECDGTVIEDDYDAEFRYDREPVGAVQGLAPDRVATIGTVSKSLAPAMRIGWVVCPPALVEATAAEKALDDRGSPGLDQLALATLIESGRFDRHLRQMRSVYAARRQALIEALAEHAPAIELTGLAAGFHAVVRLPAHADETAIVAKARERGVGLYPMSRYRLDHATTPPQIVIGFGDVSEPAIRRGIAAIGDLLLDGG
jgi:GntR family transcriptional regulator/MocR family aminotransferase